jgi:hypothetical protein
MSVFDLTQYNNINALLNFKLNNPPTFWYEEKKNMSYTTWCLDRYDQRAEQPHLYGPDLVVITYSYWHNEYGYDECKQNENECEISPIVVLGYDYDKDIRENWHDAASYHKYDRDSDDEYDY